MFILYLLTYLTQVMTNTRLDNSHATTEEHPITPPPELVQQWRKSGPADAAVNNAYEHHIATQGARWGADQELEACCGWLEAIVPSLTKRLRAARRPNT